MFSCLRCDPPHSTLAGVQIPKLVVFDVDGTLVAWDGTVTEPTARALAQLRSLGIPIALATGRPLAVADHTLGEVGGADWMACGNGAVLFEVGTGAVLRDQLLPAEVVVPIVTRMRELLPGVGFAIERIDHVLEEPGLSKRVPEPHQSPPIDDVLAALADRTDSVRRVIAYHDDYDHRLDELAAVLASIVDDRCQVQFGGLSIVDVSPRGNHKAAALQLLIDHLGIDAGDVLAFGDGGNDIEMLQWAGVGVAMGNARPHVQEVADHVTASIDGDGIAAYLEPLLKPYL